MAEAALPKSGVNPLEAAKGAEEEKKPKRGQITRGRILPRISNPVLQAKAMKAMWDYNFGRKSNFYNKESVKAADGSGVVSFEIDETDPDIKDSFGSSTEEDEDTTHNAVWIKQQQARRHHKNYHSPVSMEVTDKNQTQVAGKSFNDTTGKNDSDVSVLSASEIKKQQALRRRKNYRSPGETSLAVSFDKENVKEEMKQVLPPVRRETFAPLRDYSAVLEGLGNTTEQSSKGFDASKRSEASQKPNTRAKKVSSKQQKASAVLNAAGLEISDIIVSSGSAKKKGTRSKLLSLDEDTENLKAIGLPAASKAWKDIVTSTPLSGRPPSGPSTGSSAEAAVAAPRFKFDTLPEGANGEGDADVETEDEQNATLTEEHGAEALRGRETMDPQHNASFDCPHGDVPTDDESALPEAAEALVPAHLDRSASVNDVTAVDELASIVPEEEEASVRSAPPTPIKGRRYPVRARKPRKVCHLCNHFAKHY